MYNRDPLKLEHTLGVCLENTNIAWVVDVAGGLFIPLTYGQRGVENRRLVRSLDNFTVFFNGNYRWIVDKKNVLDSKEKITSNRRRYTTERKCCYLHPVSAMCGIYPFKVFVSDISFSFFVLQSKKMSGCFRNGVDDIEFAHLTELFFDNLENYYGSNIPFSSEDEFLLEVQEFLDFRERQLAN